MHVGVCLQEELEAQVSLLQGQINDLEAMSKYCAKMMNVHIGELNRPLKNKIMFSDVEWSSLKYNNLFVLFFSHMMNRQDSRCDPAGASAEGGWGAGITCWT